MKKINNNKQYDTFDIKQHWEYHGHSYYAIYIPEMCVCESYVLSRIIEKTQILLYHNIHDKCYIINSVSRKGIDPSIRLYAYCKDVYPPRHDVWFDMNNCSVVMSYNDIKEFYDLYANKSTIDKNMMSEILKLEYNYQIQRTKYNIISDAAKYDCNIIT